MKTTVLASFSALMVTLLLSVTVNTGIIAAADTDSPPVSPALSIIAEQTPMARAGLVDNEILFSPRDFERVLNLSRIGSITVTATPAATDGELLIGSSRIREGQTVSRANLELLSFAAAADCRQSSFEFRVDDSPYTLRCRLYLLDRVNGTPTAGSQTLTVGTYRDVSAYGRLPASDPEGDELTYQVVSYPRHGCLSVAADGAYTYTPSASYTGQDSFKYVVYDKYGNYSAAREVQLAVNVSTSAAKYEDMTSSHAYAAAIRLTDLGVMNGTRVGDVSYFYPERGVTRCEFTVMALKAAGVSSLPAVSSTGFADDGDIPTALKPYIATAARLGYVRGCSHGGETYFLPDAQLSVAEAATIASAIMGLDGGAAIPTFAGDASSPVWARAAVGQLVSLGALPSDASLDFGDSLTRETAAVLLSALADK